MMSLTCISDPQRVKSRRVQLPFFYTLCFIYTFIQQTFVGFMALWVFVVCLRKISQQGSEISAINL